MNRRKVTLLALQHVNERPWLVLAAVLIPYLVLSSISATWKPLWIDEQFTYYVARSGGWRAIWTALSSGADNHPPLDYWLRSVVMGQFGSGELVFRAPSILAFWIAAMCVYRFVRRRVEPSFALIAFLVPFSTVAYEVSVEGRYQAVMLAFAALALISWQSAAEGNRLALVVMGASLALGLFTDYNAVLSFVPVVVGEAVRTIRNRKADPYIWVVLLLAAASGAALLPLIQTARQYAGAFWTPVTIFHAVEIYSTIFFRISTVVLAFVTCFLWIGRDGVAEKVSAAKSGIPIHEFAAAVSCLLLPMFCFVLAKLVTGALQWRYVLETSVGAGIVAAYGVRRVGSIFPAAPLVLLIFLFGNAVGQESGILFRSRKARRALQADNLAVVLPPKNMPVVLGYNEWSLQRLHYLPDELRSRLTYVYDYSAGLRIRGSDEAERAVSGLGMIGPVRVQQYSKFVQTNRHFWLLLARDNQRWLVPKLLEDAADLRVRGTYQDAPVFEVVLPDVGIAKR